MKEDLRMNAKSPDPDDLASDDLPESASPEAARPGSAHKDNASRRNDDRSAPHIPPVEKGRIRGE
jgi:hypothetical protein